MRHSIACIISLLFSATLSAQETLSNETILKLVKAGIGEDVIVGMVNQQPGKYSLATDDIIALKTAGVSDRIIAAIIVRSSAIAHPTAPQPTANGITNVAVSSQPVSQLPVILHDGTPVRLRLKQPVSKVVRHLVSEMF